MFVLGMRNKLDISFWKVRISIFWCRIIIITIVARKNTELCVSLCVYVRVIIQRISKRENCVIYAGKFACSMQHSTCDRIFDEFSA